ncbi:hypothetical protein J7T55_002319 [Diaporthe amygdali]|uniref:uncharacterized protein n=1 Tax=Phomopsis amygdali TaxID=1214568 RepID=UPI0022FE9B16|nr:uncharacterized protein J7T55_002319 [Diaporthe amygdali]KAJ0109127.1 hypothetical protein J7T55_002319 [Diaporthe amygdali]
MFCASESPTPISGSMLYTATVTGFGKGLRSVETYLPSDQQPDRDNFGSIFEHRPFRRSGSRNRRRGWGCSGVVGVWGLVVLST